MKTLEQYLKENYDKNIIDHSLRVLLNNDGKVVFYIHANSFDSDTLDFEVKNNMLAPRQLDYKILQD